MPPSNVLKLLVAAAPSDRMTVLMASEAEVLSHCIALLAECRDPWILEERTLIERAFATFNAGFFEAAMTLAVTVAEPLALWASEPRVQAFDSLEEKQQWETEKKRNKYGLAGRELGAVVVHGKKLAKFEPLRLALIGPIPKFFTPF